MTLTSFQEDLIEFFIAFCILPLLQQLYNARFDYIDKNFSLILNRLPDIIQNYKSENEIIIKDKIYASLAVDTFFKPEVKVKIDGTTGFIHEIENKKKKKKFNSFSKYF